MVVVAKKAVKHQAKLKACIVGPSGSGKTYTALTFAKELADGGKILVLDSEKGSASLYSDQFDFDVVELWSRDEQRKPIQNPFSPEKYMEVIAYAEEHGYAVLVIDSLTHVWNDEGGFLDIINRVAKQRYKGNSWAAWNDIDPMYRKFVNAITDARLHVICTMRSKTETIQDKDDNNRSVIKKLGTKAMQREGLEYEFTTYFQMELDNTLIVEKTRCSAIRGAVVSCPTGDFLKPVKAWLNSGAPVEVVESEKPEQQEQAPASTATKQFPPYYEVYQIGKEKGLWQGLKSFCIYASRELGTNVTAENAANLEQAQLDQIKASITGEDPALVAADK